MLLVLMLLVLDLPSHCGLIAVFVHAGSCHMASGLYDPLCIGCSFILDVLLTYCLHTVYVLFTYCLCVKRTAT